MWFFFYRCNLVRRDTFPKYCFTWLYISRCKLECIAFLNVFVLLYIAFYVVDVFLLQSPQKFSKINNHLNKYRTKLMKP